MASGSINNNAFMAEPISNHTVLEGNAEDVKAKVELLILTFQKEFCRALEKFEDSKKFCVNKWKHTEGGGGITCLMEDGTVFEKASINISVIHGVLTPLIYQMMRRKKVSYSDKMPFFTAGITTFVHPKNPHIPTLHFSYRYFEVDLDNDNKSWWFGGCTAMTPCILNEDDFRAFHQVLKSCCDEYNESYYSCFKKKCDEYFYLPHRGESLGIGGILFDDLNTPDPKSCFQFVSACLKSTIPSYIPIVEKNLEEGYLNGDKQWQSLRRGRYVEFNLMYDKETRGALMIPGVQYENILMCLPPTAKWQNCCHPKEDSKEQKLLNILRNPKDWI